KSVSRYHWQLAYLGCRVEWTRTAFQVGFEFAAPFVHNGHCGNGGGIAERAERASQHVLCQVLDVIYIFFQTAAGMEAGKRLFQPVCAFAAGNTPATAFVLVELHDAQGEL